MIQLRVTWLCHSFIPVGQCVLNAAFHGHGLQERSASLRRPLIFRRWGGFFRRRQDSSAASGRRGRACQCRSACARAREPSPRALAGRQPCAAACSRPPSHREVRRGLRCRHCAARHGDSAGFGEQSAESGELQPVSDGTERHLGGQCCPPQMRRVLGRRTERAGHRRASKSTC